MDIDWQRLGEVRERQKAAAQQRVAADRQAMEESCQQAEQARHQWQHQMSAKQQLWQEAAGALSGGAFSVAQMRQAGAWSQALDAQIAQAGLAVQQAQAVVHQRQAVLDASRRQLRQAAGELEKARQMQQRARADQIRVREQRLEDGAEEAAVQTWRSRRL